MKNNRRYYLHFKLKKMAGVVKIAARKRTIEVEPGLNEEVLKYTKQLAAIGYNIQIVIPIV